MLTAYRRYILTLGPPVGNIPGHLLIHAHPFCHSVIPSVINDNLFRPSLSSCHSGETIYIYNLEEKILIKFIFLDIKNQTSCVLPSAKFLKKMKSFAIEK